LVSAVVAGSLIGLLVVPPGERASAQLPLPGPDTQPPSGTGNEPGSEPGASDEPGPGPETELQVLAIDETADQVVVEIALPGGLGRPTPIDQSFGVIDGGESVGVEATPLDTASTVLVVDTSGSMRGPSLAAAKAAASSFVDALPPDVEIGLVSFGETVVVHREPTVDRADLDVAIDDLATAGGETALWDALVTAADLVDGPVSDGASLVVVSDGGDTISSAGRDEAVDRLVSRSLVLYAVAVDSPEVDREALATAVDQVGGQYLAATDPEQLDELYTDIAGRLANRYRVSFVPAISRPRTVEVSVRIDGTVATTQLTLSGPPPSDGSTTGPGTSSVPQDRSGDQEALGSVTVGDPLPVDGPILLWGGALSVFTALFVGTQVLARPPAQIELATAAGAADRLAGIRDRLGRAVEWLISRHDRERRLDTRLDAADVQLRPGEFVLVVLVLTALVGLLSGLVAGPLVAILTLLVPGLIVNVVLGVRASRCRARFADQLTETLSILTSSLRAGQSLPRAVELVATEAPAPTAQQFQRVHFEVRVGRDLTESLRDVGRRMQSDDVEWLAQAVDIHRELGGDLTEILGNLGGTIRERRTVARQIEALSAEGRATGWVLLTMPIILLLFSWWRTPGNIELMVDRPLGRILLGAAVIGMAIGRLWIRELVKIKY
jgi:tight adherence protein B